MKVKEINKETVRFEDVPLRGFFVISGGLYIKLQNLVGDSGAGKNQQTNPFGALVAVVEGELERFSSRRGEGYVFRDDAQVHLVEIDELRWYKI